MGWRSGIYVSEGFSGNKSFCPGSNRGAATIYSFSLGGKASSSWQSLGDNKWIATAYLRSHEQEYYVWFYDPKVTELIEGRSPTIAEKLFARTKGSAVWIELTCIVPHPFGGAGKATKMILISSGQIQVPSR